MKFHAVFAFCIIAAAVILPIKAQKLSYVDNPNNYNCEHEVVEYSDPSDQIKTREIKSSYVYYNMPQDTVPVKYVTKYSPVKKYYPPVKKDSRFYQVFQPTGERSYEPATKGSSKAPAIQIYVV